MIKRPGWIPKSIAYYHPLLLKIAIWFRIIERHLILLFDRHKYSKNLLSENLKYRVKKHQSVLIRKLGDQNLKLQHNKVDNLKIVIQKLDGIIINPGETFSFYKLVGKPTRRNGFKKGMELSRGQAKAGIGGGICQSTNLIYWLILHSPLTVVERHHHSFDPFPDQKRVLPFASGATVMYNYRDLRFKNNTPYNFQFRFWLDKKCLNGDLRCSDKLQYSYSVIEKNHYYELVNDKYFRNNELWRKVIDKNQNGKTIREEFMVKNYAEVKYIPSSEKFLSTSSII